MNNQLIKMASSGEMFMPYDMALELRTIHTSRDVEYFNELRETFLTGKAKAFPEWDITKVQSAVDSDLKFAGRLADNPSLKERVNKYLDAHHQSITMVMYLPEEPFGPVGEYIQNLLH